MHDARSEVSDRRPQGNGARPGRGALGGVFAEGRAERRWTSAASVAESRHRRSEAVTATTGQISEGVCAVFLVVGRAVPMCSTSLRV